MTSRQFVQKFTPSPSPLHHLFPRLSGKWDLPKCPSQRCYLDADGFISEKYTLRVMYRQSSVKLPPIKNTSSNNTLRIFHPFFTLPIITLAIVKIEQKSIVHLKINYDWMQDLRGAHFLLTNYLMCPPLSLDHRNIEINNINKLSLYTCLFIGEQLGYRSHG